MNATTGNSNSPLPYYQQSDNITLGLGLSGVTARSSSSSSTEKANQAAAVAPSLANHIIEKKTSHTHTHTHHPPTRETFFTLSSSHLKTDGFFFSTSFIFERHFIFSFLFTPPPRHTACLGACVVVLLLTRSESQFKHRPGFRAHFMFLQLKLVSLVNLAVTTTIATTITLLCN
jgi:hypothetical protein